MKFFVAVCVGWCLLHVVCFLLNIGMQREVVLTIGIRAADVFISLIVVCWGIWLLAKS